MRITLDAYLHVYRERRAVYEALKAFRSYHPESFVSLVVDGGGTDCADIATRFRCDYRRCDINIDPSARMPPEYLREWLNRFVTAARQSSADFMLLLEDDVMIRGPIDWHTSFDIAGSATERTEFRSCLLQELRKVAPNASRYFGARLVRRAALIDSAERVDWKCYERWLKLDGRLATPRPFLTFIFALAGYPYTPASEICAEMSNGRGAGEKRYAAEDVVGRPILHGVYEFRGRGDSEEMMADLCCYGRRS